MARRPRLLSPDVLLVLGVLGFAAALVFLVLRGDPGPQGTEAGGKPAPAGRPAEPPEAVARAGPRTTPAPKPVPPPATAQAPAPGPGAPAPAPGPPQAAADPTPPSPGARGRAPRVVAGTDTPTPESKLFLRGRVLTPGGRPVPGIGVSARPLDRGPDLRERKTRSKGDGRFFFEGLSAGRYRLVSDDTPRYRSANTAARAGSEGVDLVVRPRSELRAWGRITDDRDSPVSGVEVQAFGQAARTASDDDGEYELVFPGTEGSDYVLLRFRAKGYADHEIRLRRLDLTGEGARQDAQLAPDEGRFAVEGRLRTDRGELPSGINVMLRSSEHGATLHGLSDAEGRFRIERVEEGRDWRVAVRPGQGFGDAKLGPLHLHDRSDDLEILLPSLETGVVTGRLVDPRGQRIPDYTLTVTSRTASAQSRVLRSDKRGEFLVEDVPAGEILFETRAVPQLRVAGVDLDPGEREDLEIVLDVGEFVLEGRVLGERGKPITGAGLRLEWQKSAAGLRSSSFRRTLSDSDGRFRFHQLGPGPHGLVVQSARYRPWRATVSAEDAGAGLEIRLERTP